MQYPPRYTVDFLGAFQDVKQCFDLEAPEYAFIGRSNVGKSSMINFLTGQSELARTSKKPGKTQTINLFRVDAEPFWILADLPGYGYARVSRSQRGTWASMIEHYILGRKNLMNLFLLVDLRVPPQASDLNLIRFLGEHAVPFCILFTKADQLKPAEEMTALQAYSNLLLEEWEELPPMVVTSSLRQRGRADILDMIREMNAIFTTQQAQ